MPRGTYAYWKKRGKEVNHHLIGKRVYYRPYSSKVVDRFLGKYAGVVIGARRVNKGYITLAMRHPKTGIHYATARMLTTKKPKRRK